MACIGPDVFDYMKDTNPFQEDCPAIFLKGLARNMTLDDVSLGKMIFRSQYLRTFCSGENVAEVVGRSWSEFICGLSKRPASISEIAYVKQQKQQQQAQQVAEQVEQASQAVGAREE